MLDSSQENTQLRILNRLEKEKKKRKKTKVGISWHDLLDTYTPRGRRVGEKEENERERREEAGVGEKINEHRSTGRDKVVINLRSARPARPSFSLPLPLLLTPFLP